MILDTGSDWMVVESRYCQTCLNNTWDNSISRTYKMLGNDYIEHVYGSAILHGYDISDAVSMDLEGKTRVSKFEFFEIHEQKGIHIAVDGILGMSRRSTNKDYKAGPLWIDALFNETLIDKRIFSFYLTNNPSNNYVDIGFADNKAMKSSSPVVGGLVTIPLQNTNSLFWWQNCDSIRFGESG